MPSAGQSGNWARVARAEADDTRARHFWSVVDQYRTVRSVEIEPNRSTKVLWLSEVWTTDATVIHVTAGSDLPKQLAPAGGTAPLGTRVACAIGGAFSGANRGGTPSIRQAGSPGRSLATATTPVTAAARRIQFPRTPANVPAMAYGWLQRPDLEREDPHLQQSWPHIIRRCPRVAALP